MSKDWVYPVTQPICFCKTSTKVSYDSTSKSQFQETLQPWAQQQLKFLISWIHLISMYINGFFKGLVCVRWIPWGIWSRQQPGQLPRWSPQSRCLRTGPACLPSWWSPPPGSGGHLLVQVVTCYWGAHPLTTWPDQHLARGKFSARPEENWQSGKNCDTTKRRSLRLEAI